MSWLHTASSFLAISQLVFLACLYSVYFPRRLISRLIVLFSICITAYILVRSDVDWPLAVRLLLTILATLAQAVLWVIARCLFEDQRRVHPGVAAMIIFYMVIRTIGLLSYGGSVPQDSTFLYLLYFYIPQWIMLFLACHVVYMACRGREGDLVESRRQVRVPFAIGMGTIVGVIIGSGFFQFGGPQLDTLYFMVIFGLILFVNLAMFRLQNDAPQLIQTAIEQPRIAASTVPTGTVSRHDQQLIDRVLTAMRQERLYAEPGLTIGDLAAKVSLQEYRLRRLINQAMHFRNFNQFLNQYRIEEAARRLRDPEEEHIPISSIALDVGYVSLSSFNKAFKETHGVTPSVWRTQTDAQHFASGGQGE